MEVIPTLAYRLSELRTESFLEAHNSDPSFNNVIQEHCPGGLCGFRSISSQVGIIAPPLSSLLNSRYYYAPFHSAARGGADRLEVCGNLGIGGGTTPSLGLVRAIQKAVPHVPIMVGHFPQLIRTR